MRELGIEVTARQQSELTATTKKLSSAAKKVRQTLYMYVLKNRQEFATIDQTIEQINQRYGGLTIQARRQDNSITITEDRIEITTIRYQEDGKRPILEELDNALDTLSIHIGERIDGLDPFTPQDFNDPETGKWKRPEAMIDCLNAIPGITATLSPEPHDNASTTINIQRGHPLQSGNPMHLHYYPDGILGYGTLLKIIDLLNTKYIGKPELVS